ncbi:formyltransferase family protein [Bradyrhizobium sp. ARR65]|uniref:formyltransferase family protein n=1 Tax=Bradyrhizobium sp. ARR65 TaxID=1040989 RepID=UPI000463E964|nr:formyltransferase family protein [Bradyrhizobium sp. ARR65]
MLKTIILLTATPHQQHALSVLLMAHNPALSFRKASRLEDLAAIEPGVWRNARLVAFTTGVIVPQAMLEALGHGAYNFHPGPPDYPGWAPANFAIYDGARRFGATMHVMAAKVDSGPIVGVESFVVPDNISVRELEQIAYVRLGHLFWRKAREIACEPGPLPALPIGWSGTKSTRQMYRDYCELPATIDAAELKRRIRAFDDDFRGIPLTITLHGLRFRLSDVMERQAEPPPHVDAPSLAAFEMRA